LAAVPEVRDAQDGEVDEIVDLLSRAAFGPTVARLIAFPRSNPHGHLLVARAGRSLVGAVGCLSFGATGWIGALGVAPRARRRGLGTELTTAAIDHLRERGARTVLLFATDLGRPVYERLGFAVEGEATAWRGTAGQVSDGVSVRRLCEEDRACVVALDREATGERREPLLDALVPLSGLAVERDGAMVGWAARSPYGAGVSICAREPDAGAALMAAAAGPVPATLVVPEANAAASERLRRWGFQSVKAGDRMRLGEPVAWRPERQFGLFNLFWG
jgi:ribosomal protein S18 acetylase RimI-like enzyme